MSQSAIHQAWEANSLMLPRDVANTAVEVGNPLGFDGTNVLTASEEAWDTDAATTRRNFVQHYAGDSAQAADAGEYIFANGQANQSNVRVDTAGLTRLVSLAAGTYAVGTLLGPKKDAGNALMDGTFDIVTDEREATHRVVYAPTATNPSWCVAQIISRLFPPAPAGGDAVMFHFPVDLSGVSAADVVTNFTPGFAGAIVGFDFVVNKPVTTAAKAATLNLEIGTTDLTGGVLSLTSAAATPLGKVISATAITGANEFADDDTISVEATSVTAFAEGSGVLIVKCRRKGG